MHSTDERHGGQNEPEAIVADQIDNYASSCVAYVKQSLGIALDYSTETLPLLDHYLTEARNDVTRRPEALDVLTVTAGSYVGELIRRRHDGSWDTSSDDPMAWAVRLLDGQLRVYPMAIAWLALHPESEDEQPPTFELTAKLREPVERHLASLPAVPEDEFYAPSTRIEVIDIIVDWVMNQRATDEGKQVLEIATPETSTPSRGKRKRGGRRDDETV